jgi:hypothetical protein
MGPCNERKIMDDKARIKYLENILRKMFESNKDTITMIEARLLFLYTFNGVVAGYLGINEAENEEEKGTPKISN